MLLQTGTVLRTATLLFRLLRMAHRVHAHPLLSAALAALLLSFLATRPVSAGPRCRKAVECFDKASKLKTPGKAREAYTLYLRSCKKRHAPGCLAAAELRWDHLGHWPLPGEMTRLYGRACRLDPGACTLLKRLRAFMSKIPRCKGTCAISDYPRERNGGIRKRPWDFVFHSVLCNRRVAASCRWLGTTYRDAPMSRADLVLAGRLFRRACKLGSQPACGDGKSLVDSTSCGDKQQCADKIVRGIKARIKPALLQRLHERGCKAGAVIGCFYGGSALKTTNPRAATSMLRRGCGLGDADCCRELAGHLYTVSKGKKMAASTRLMRQACKLKPRSCVSLMKWLVGRARANPAITELERLCERACGGRTAMYICRDASKLLYREAKKSKNLPPKIAHRILAATCGRFVGAACLELAVPCHSGKQCLELGNLFRHPRGLYGNVPAAIKVFERACTVYRKYDACQRASELLEKKDPGKARALARAACNGSYRTAVCMRYASLLARGSAEWRSILARTCAQRDGTRACQLLGGWMRKNQPRVARRQPTRPAQPGVSAAKHKLLTELVALKRELKRLEAEIDAAKPEYIEFKSNSEAWGRKHGQTVLKCTAGRCEYVSRRFVGGNARTHKRLLRLHEKKLRQFKGMVARYNSMR